MISCCPLRLATCREARVLSESKLLTWRHPLVHGRPQIAPVLLDTDVCGPCGLV